jgi:hypothetical protein
MQSDDHNTILLISRVQNHEASERPHSVSFSTLKDSDDVNRIIIDTTEQPWLNMERYRTTYNIFYGLSVYNNLKHLIEGRYKGLHNKIMFNEFEKLNAMKLNFTEPDIVDDEDEIAVLWKKIIQVECIIYTFIRLYFFIEVLKKRNGDSSFPLKKYSRLFEFVSLHTQGPIHVLAKSFVFEYSCMEITMLNRGEKCSICYEHGRNSHFCNTKMCGHQFHVACLLKMQSPDCPICRRLD